MGGITEKITEFIKDLLTGWITSNLDTMFTDVNTKVETIAAEVGKTPQNWNSGIFSMIKNLSDNVIVPIAGMIITFVLCYELISMIMEKKQYARYGYVYVFQIHFQDVGSGISCYSYF